MGLAQAAGTDQQDILLLGQERALRQLQDAGLGERGNHREVEVLQPLVIGKLGLPQERRSWCSWRWVTSWASSVWR